MASLPTTPASPSELSWREAADALPVLLYTLTPGGEIEFVNAAFSEQTGHERDAAVKGVWRAIIHAEDLARVEPRLAAALAAGDVFDEEFRVRLADGTYRRFRSIARPYRDGEGRTVRWFGTAIDTEQQAQAVTEAAESERRLQRFLETVPVIVWTADASGWIDWYNPRWHDYTGQTRAEAAGWGWQAVHHPDDLPRVMEAWPHSIATGEPFEMEFRLRRHDGTFRWFLTRIVPLTDGDGRVVRWYGSNIDIEEQKRTEQRSHRIAQTLQEAFLPDRFPEVDGVRFDALYLPAEREALVGGDFYDAVALPDGTLLLSCGDVAGHGLEAAVNAGRVRQAIVIAALDASDPAAILARVNRVVRFQGSPLVTAAVALLDPATLVLRYALAGHPPPIVAPPGGPARLEPYAEAPPLGVVDGFAAPTARLTLEAGTFLALYTDGMTETRRKISADERRLVRAVGALREGIGAEGPAAHVRDATIGSERPFDDAAILIVRCGADGEDETTPAAPRSRKTWRFHSSDARTARLSRVELIAYLRSFTGDESALGDAELVLGELLANAVEHAPGLVEIVIDWSGRHPVLVMRDSGPGLAQIEPVLPDALSEDGRGLFLVRTLSLAFTVRRAAGYGTEMTVVLPLEKHDEHVPGERR